MVKSRYIGDGHPTFNRNPYDGYINPYYWVDDHPLLYGNNGSLDPGTFEQTCKFASPFFYALKNIPISPPSLESKLPSQMRFPRKNGGTMQTRVFHPPWHSLNWIWYFTQLEFTCNVFSASFWGEVFHLRLPNILKSKIFPTYPWNIPQTQFMKEFVSFGDLGMPGVWSRGMLGLS